MQKLHMQKMFIVYGTLTTHLNYFFWFFFSQDDQLALLDSAWTEKMIMLFKSKSNMKIYPTNTLTTVMIV